MFSASYLIAGWLLIFVGAARQHLDLPGVARALQLLEYGERLRVVARRLDVSPSVVSRLWIRYQETGEYTRREGSPFAAPMCSIVNLRMLLSTRFFGGFTIPWGP